MNPKPPSAKRLTPIGRGAVATIVIEGNFTVLNSALDCFFHAANGTSAAQQKFNRISYGVWGDQHQEDLVGIRLSESQFEIHCHGGAVAVQRILNDLKGAGIETSQSLELKTTELSLREEFQLCLQQATTQKTAHHLLRQSQIFPNAVDDLKDVGHSHRIVLAEEMLQWSEFGKHLIHPWRVVLCGSPNVGKSSLINSLVGYSRSVVYDQPGTTRDVVAVQTALDGWPIEFSDTAGLRETTENLESLGIERAKATIQTADLLLVVTDAQEEIFPFEKSLLKDHPKTLLVVNKIDLVPNHQTVRESISVSAINDEGIKDLATRIVAELIPRVPFEEQPFPVTQRQVEILQTLLEKN